jgi:hypothetical protein
MRAFRPSRFGEVEERQADPVDEIVRIAKVELYAKRVRECLPLFDEDVIQPPPARAAKGRRSR